MTVSCTANVREGRSCLIGYRCLEVTKTGYYIESSDIRSKKVVKIETFKKTLLYRIIVM